MRPNYFILLSLFLITFSACKKHDINEPTPIIPPVSLTETGLVTFSPALPVDNQSITLVLDASKGNKELFNAGGNVYIHTGVITDQSAGGWKYVKVSSFNTDEPLTKMTSLGNNKYQFILSPRSFYGVPDGEKILKLAMVFRNADGTKVCRNTDASDIYIPIYETNKLAVRFTSPEFEPTYIPKPVISVSMVGQELSISAASSQSAALSLTLNGTSFATASNATTISGKVKITNPGPQQIKISAIAGGSTAESVMNFIIEGATVNIAPLPAGAKDGVTFINNGTSAIFNLYAPNKSSAYVIGDFNDWIPEAKTFMNRTSDGKRWWVQIDGLNANSEYAYQFLVDGSLRVADPYCEKVLDPSNDPFIGATVYPQLKPYPTGKTTGIVSVMQANQPGYNWNISNFTRPDKKDLVIYELHIRDFIAAHNYNTLKDTLDYLQNLGINAIELMPINEFEGNSSWGYNPSLYFAPDKYYGTKNALKGFIDECHSRGIAVIQDMVLNHSFGQSPMVQLYFNEATGKPASNNPWFNIDPKHPYNVGYDFNHESLDTKYFVKNVLNFWMTEYKIDGFRFDLSKGFTQKTSTDDASFAAYDASRVAIWKDYNSYIKSIDPNFYVILEHFANDNEEQALSADGMMMWNNVNYNFNEASMGYVGTSDISRAFYDKHGFAQPNLVTYMESHDEERMMYKNLMYGNSSGSYNIKNLATALKRQEMAATFLISTPGPKMIWEFGELGYDIPINQNGRIGEKPILWGYAKDAQRHELYAIYSQLIKLKTNNPGIFRTGTITYNVAGAIKYIKISGGGVNVVIVGNFDVVPSVPINFIPAGNYYDVLNQNALTTINGGEVLQPGEFHLYSSAVLI